MQATLFGGPTPSIRRPPYGVRRDLGRGAWLERLPGLVCGATSLFDSLRGETAWDARRREMYGRTVDVPRLLGKPHTSHPVLEQLVGTFEHRYGWTLDRISLALYRDGRDSVAWHGDRMGALRDDCVIAIVSLGSPRVFRVRPTGGGRSQGIALQSGDALVMGGTAQRTFEHAVHKVRAAGPRIAVMFRPSARPVHHT